MKSKRSIRAMGVKAEMDLLNEELLVARVAGDGSQEAVIQSALREAQLRQGELSPSSSIYRSRDPL